MRRCQRSSVSGLTKKHDQRVRGRTRLIAASRARQAPAWVAASATQDDELVAQDEDLEILGGVATGELGEQLNREA
jgi:hypothetical protein